MQRLPSYSILKYGFLSANFYRTIVKEHIPKRHGNLEEPILTDKKFDNTHNRIHGQTDDQLMYTENYYYGKSKNPADELPRKGRRQNNLEGDVPFFSVTSFLHRFKLKSLKRWKRSKKKKKERETSDSLTQPTAIPL